MKDFRQLEVWEKSRRLATAVYRATGGWPIDERFGLTQQARRAAVSIPSNIAEGCGREGNADFARFLQMAMGSLMELDSLIAIAKDLGFEGESNDARLNAPILELRRMLSTLIRRVRSER